MANNGNYLPLPTGNGSFQNNNNINSINNNDKKGEEDLPRLGRKKSSIRKSVSFNNNISVTKVESWKQYNKDVTEETEMYKLRQQIKEFKAKQAKKLKEQNDCCCEIF